jgi:hypothetical protein
LLNLEPILGTNRLVKVLDYFGIRTRARDFLVANAWYWVVFQDTSVSMKSFRSIDQEGLPNPTVDIIGKIVSPLYSQWSW